MNNLFQLVTRYSQPYFRKSSIMKKDTKQKIVKIKIQEAIGSNIRRIRRSARKFLSAEKVANELGISRVTLTQIEKGKRNINAALLWELCCLFGCEVTEIFPPIEEGYQLSPRDVKEIQKIDPRAVSFAELAFGKQRKNKIND